MNRKQFVQKSVLAVAATTLMSKITEAKPDNKSMKQLGFNHLPNDEIKTMNSVLHPASSRGYANHGWLEARHSFSFANYYNPDRVHFGALRVLNDDKIAGGKGFGTHPHDNMEIITIPLQGALAHKDSMGNGATIEAGDIQVMSAGTGIRHSEFNARENESCQLLQIWVFPNKQGVTPRYDQLTLDANKLNNELHQILSPNPEDDGVWIHQDAWFHLGHFDRNKAFNYQLKKEGNGVYFFLLEGKIQVENQLLEARDGYGVWDKTNLDIQVLEQAKILVLEVPMEI